MMLTDKGQLLQFRARIQEQIEYLNEELIVGNNDEVTREVAYDVRDKLIECDNLINAYRLRHCGDRL